MYCFLAVMLLSFKGGADIVLDKASAKSAAVLLNRIRLNTNEFAAELGLANDLAVKRTNLIWNDTLASVAEAKATDMAKRNYFGHVDPDGYGINYYISKAGYTLEREWTAKPGANYFESLMAGSANGEAGIRSLIIDAQDANKGHRKHLLGLGDWNSKSHDIGIGFVRSSGGTYRTLMCVIIARHKW